jgi:hypothetical protein
MQASDNADSQTPTGGSTVDSQRPKSGSSTLASHLGALSIAAASTVLIALRLLSAADFNPATAYGIIQASGTANVIIGTVISLIPSIAIIAASGLILYVVFSPHKLSLAAELAAWTSMSILFLITLLTIPLRYFYAIGGCVLFILILLLFRKRIKTSIENHRDTQVVRNAARVFGFIIAVTLIFGVVLSPPWMPAEYLVLNNGQSITGYILSETQNGMTVLQINPREVLYYDDPRLLKSESICSNGPKWDYPIIYYLHLRLHLSVLNPYHYDSCSSLKG